MTYNQHTVSIKLTRIELCDLLIATTSTAFQLEREGKNASKWHAVHDKLEAQLEAWDKKHGPQYFGE